MPRFVSDGGVWTPAMERAVIEKTNPVTGEKEPEIYVGQDREALKLLEEAGEETLGQHFSMNPDMFALARQMGYKDVNEYVKAIGFNETQAKELAAKKKAEINTHALPDKKPELKIIDGGGQDRSGNGNGIVGGFGEAEYKPVKK